MKKDDKVRIIQEESANGNKYPHFNKIATVIQVNGIGQVQVSIDSFPNVNHRDHHNKFWFSNEELEIMEE